MAPATALVGTNGSTDAGLSIVLPAFDVLISTEHQECPTTEASPIMAPIPDTRPSVDVVQPIISSIISLNPDIMPPVDNGQSSLAPASINLVGLLR